jgi:hypothetical protein
MDQGRFLAAHVGARPHPQLQMNVDVAAVDAAPQPVLLLGGGDGAAQTRNRQGIFSAHVEVAPLGAHGEGRDGHALQQPVGVALHHRAVHEGTRVTLIGIAHQPLLAPGHGRHRGPLQAGGIAGAAAAPQAAAPHRLDHSRRIVLLQHGP